MSDSSSATPAYVQHSLLSEQYRVAALIVLTSLTLVVATVRYLLASEVEGSWMAAGPLIIPFAIAYEISVFRVIRRNLALNRPLPNWFWIVNLVIECTFPTLALLVFWSSEGLTGRQALTTPPVIGYEVFVILSTLRMSPALAIASGVICGVEYLVLVFVVTALEPTPLTTGHLPDSLLFTFPGIFVVTGLAAGFVAARVRAHVAAMVKESEQRQEFEQELDVAARIQQGLLPAAAPEFDGYDIAGWSRPAAHTGGDFYDWLTLPDGSLAVMIADVTGHGLGPALMTANCRAYARGALMEERDLAVVLGRVNELLQADLPDDRFVTCALVRIDAGSSDVHVLSAGHGPIVIFRAATNEVEMHDADQSPLGILDELPFDPRPAFTLGPGDVIVLVTDGFFEWAGPDGSLFGLKRLGEAIRENASHPSATLIDVLRRRVEQFADGVPQADDLTAVVIRRLRGAK